MKYSTKVLSIRDKEEFDIKVRLFQEDGWTLDKEVQFKNGKYYAYLKREI